MHQRYWEDKPWFLKVQLIVMVFCFRTHNMLLILESVRRLLSICFILLLIFEGGLFLHYLELWASSMYFNMVLISERGFFFYCVICCQLGTFSICINIPLIFKGGLFFHYVFCVEARSMIYISESAWIFHWFLRRILSCIMCFIIGLRIWFIFYKVVKDFLINNYLMN